MKAAAKYLLLTVLILITVSCTKKNEANLLENELLNRLPENTAGFLITKLDGEPGKKLRDTPWGQSSDKNSKIIESLIGEANGKLAKEVAFGKSLEESFAKSQSILFCLLPRDKSKFSIAGLVKTENSESAKEISRLFKEKIDAEGHKVEEIQIADVNGLRISIPEDNLELYIASKNEYISLGNDLELTSKLIDQSKASPEVITKIKATPSFISAREKVTVDQNTLAFGYIDSSQLTDFYFKAEQDKTKQNPLNSVIYVRSFDDGLNDHGVISTNENALVANNKSLKDLSSGLSLLNNAASSSISYFGISGNLIKIIADQLQKNNEELIPAEFNNLSAIGLGFTPSTGQSIFPDIYAVINSPNSNELHAALKQALSGAVKQQALPTSQWTKKNILGVDTEYMVSMLGVGVYLAPSEDKLILGSSESAITTAIKTAKGEKSSLSSSLSAKAQNLALKDNGLVAGHMNFPELALTLKSLHGSMAMFSGGETPSLKELEEITKYGSITFNVTTNGNIIELASRVDLPPESPK